MTDLEIPFEKDRPLHYRFFEILPGTLSWGLLLTPLILTFISATAAVFFILFYLLIFFVRGVAYAFGAAYGYLAMREQLALDWPALLADIEGGKVSATKARRPKWHLSNLKYLYRRRYDLKPSELLHAVIIATVNETREILEPTIQAVLATEIDPKKIILLIAYEGRAGAETAQRVEELINLYGGQFRYAAGVCHPARLSGEIIGKGSNLTYSGHYLKKYLKDSELDTQKVIVTTLDADNRPDKRYFAALEYVYCTVPDPIKAAFQPIAMFTNNIWDAPSLMRVVAAGNSNFYIVGTQRPHLSRNFSAHSQSAEALIAMDFWSVRTIVEDGHQFWRSYFFFDGDYRVYPMSVPIYQDAVLARTYLKTLKAQFYQVRRWTYGASDIAYIADKGFWQPNKINKVNVLHKLLRTLEMHVNWACNYPIVLFAAFVPPLLKPQSIATNELPLLVSRVQTVGIIFFLMLVYISLITLPPRPARYKRHRSLLMLAQWGLLPVVSLCYSSLAALNSQNRLMFKRYLNKFDVTEKATNRTKKQPAVIAKLTRLGLIRYKLGLAKR